MLSPLSCSDNAFLQGILKDISRPGMPLMTLGDGFPIAQPYLAGVADGDVRVLLKEGHLPGQLFRLPEIIGVQKGQKAAGGRPGFCIPDLAGKASMHQRWGLSLKEASRKDFAG